MRFVVVALCSLLLIIAVSACTSSPPMASAHRVANRAELIGGPRALGEVGDWMLENGRVRFIVQDAGFSRGFGVYGGALLDADLVREEGRGNSEGGTGKDNFGEMFPAFFLEALEPREVEDPNDPRNTLAAIEVENDGSNGEAAVLVVRGTGGDFIAMTQKINELLLGDSRINPTLLFETRYILEPDATYVKMTTRVQNIALPATTLRFPNAVLPGGSVVPTPFGDVVLFGAGNDVFAPHPAGYDIRFTLEDLYASNSIALPALPGITAEFLASSGKDVSYGMLVEPPTAPTTNFVLANADQFPGATDHSLHVPFIASAFTGVFQVLPPPTLTANDGAPGGTDEMEFSRYFFVGDGDVASISDQVFAKLGVATGTLTGRVRNAAGEPVLDASIVVVDAAGAKTTQMTTDSGGRFVANVRPGTYDLVIVKEGQASERIEDVVVTEGAVTRKEIEFALPALISVTVVEAGKGRIPAKVTLVGTTPPDHVGEDTDTWLYDLSIGEHFRYSDFVPDVASDENTLRYIEHFDYTADGTLTFAARPGSYTVVVGRGLEYDRVEVPVTLKAGATATVNAELRRTVDTKGYVGADFHLHSVFSLDSNANLKDRITSYAGEGIEFAVATDHNYVVDYRATIEKAGLQRFINSAIGLELTTIDRGHFNGFPLDRGDGVVDNIEAGTIASRTYGSFEWALRDPGDIFADLRALGRKNPDGSVADIILQVNHPRDSILGYFDQYGVDAETLEVEGQSGLIAPDPVAHPEFSKEAFSFDFDAIEVFNGKRFELLKTFVVPDGVTRDPASCCPLTAGDVFREYPEPSCADDVDSAECNCLPEVCAADEAVCEARQQAQLAANRCGTNHPVAFPGVLDDWLHLLAAGKRVVGTANSDSHEPDKEEPGSPRTFIAVPRDEPSEIGPDDVVNAFKAGNLLMTNGPFVRVTATNAAGDTVGLGGLVSGDSITLHITVDQAAWVKADTVRIYKGPTQLPETHAIAHPHAELDVVVDIDDDTFLIVEAASFDPATTLFPSIYPNEIPSLQFSDVIGSLGGSLGLATLDGALEPALSFVTTPYALTNPIFVDGDGDGLFTSDVTVPGQPDIRSAPRRQAKVLSSSSSSSAGVVFGPEPQPQTTIGLTRPIVTVPTEEQAELEAAREAWRAVPMRKKKTLSRLPRWLWPSNDPRDVRRVLVQFVRHAH